MQKKTELEVKNKLEEIQKKLTDYQNDLSKVCKIEDDNERFTKIHEIINKIKNLGSEGDGSEEEKN